MTRTDKAGSQQWALSCFALLGARQHCVAKICNASQRTNLHKLQMTRSLYQVPYFGLTCAPKHAEIGVWKQVESSTRVGGLTLPSLECLQGKILTRLPGYH